MKTIVRFVGDLPFSGKFAISDLYFKFLGSKTKQEQLSNYLLLLALLLLLVVGHGAQVNMGYEALSFNSPLWSKAIFLMYALVNVLVVIVQVYLVFQTTAFLFKRRLSKTDRPVPSFTPKEVTTALLVTLGGQIAFLVPYCIYS